MNNPLVDAGDLPRFADITPEHVVPAIRELIAANRQKLESLLDGAAAPSFESLVAPLEVMDQQLAKAWSPVSHLQGVLGSEEWRQAYNDALPLLTEYGTELAQNARLQRAFAAVEASLGEEADDARRSLVRLALRDFHLAGVDLPEAEKARFKDIMQELATTQAAFEHNVQDASDAWSLHLDGADALAGLAAQTLERAAAEAESRGLAGFVLTLDFPTYHDVMMHAEDRGLRETLYRAWLTRASDQGENPAWDNSGNIAKILALRYEAARLVGFDNYAEFSLATKMAGSPAEVLDFLNELADRSRPAGEREVAALEALAGERLEAWDVTFWLEKFKQSRYSISNEELRQYFPAERVVAGLFRLAERLYGIRLEAEDGKPVWHPDVRFYRVSDEDGREIGGFYTDLHARSGKRTGAWVADYTSRMRVESAAAQPIGYLVCNFPPVGDGRPSLLTHTDVVTLFHEFGHMLHHLLTRIDYPSIAGINGVPWDAVELPSQFMENFAWNFEVLERCSAHVETGASLPRELFDKLDDSRHAGAALAMLRQLEFALFDFRLHVEYAPDAGTDLLGILREVRDRVALVPHPDYNRFPHSFSHIFGGGYGAGYYSYKWAEVLAADAFGAFEEAGIFDPATARRFREEILEIGGSRDIMQAFIAFRGRKPRIDALLRQSGIESA